MIAAVDAGALVLKRRPDTTIRLTPLYADAFYGSIGFVRFHRDAAGKVTSFSVTQDRVWDMRFQRSRQSAVGSRQSQSSVRVDSPSQQSQSTVPACWSHLGTSASVASRPARSVQQANRCLGPRPIWFAKAPRESRARAAL